MDKGVISLTKNTEEVMQWDYLENQKKTKKEKK